MGVGERNGRALSDLGVADRRASWRQDLLEDARDLLIPGVGADFGRTPAETAGPVPVSFRLRDLAKEGEAVIAVEEVDSRRCRDGGIAAASSRGLDGIEVGGLDGEVDFRGCGAPQSLVGSEMSVVEERAFDVVLEVGGGERRFWSEGPDTKDLLQRTPESLEAGVRAVVGHAVVAEPDAPCVEPLAELSGRERPTLVHDQVTGLAEAGEAFVDERDHLLRGGGTLVEAPEERHARVAVEQGRE